MRSTCTIFGWRILFNTLSNQEQGWTYRYLSSLSSLDKIQKIDRCQTIIIGKSPHLARKYGVRQSQKLFEKEIQTLLEACKPSRVIFVSSVSVYGNASKSCVPFREDSALLGSTPYAKEKISIEQNLQQRSVELGFQLLILRPSGLFGLPDPLKRNNLIDRLKDADSQKVMPGLKIDDDGQQIRDFCEFPFLTEVIKFFMGHPNRNGIYNIASTGYYKINELIEIFGQCNNVQYSPAKTKLIHNCVSTDRLMHDLRVYGASKKLIEILETRVKKLTIYN